MKVAYLVVLALLVNDTTAILLNSEQRTHKKSSMGSRMRLRDDSELTLLSSQAGELFPDDQAKYAAQEMDDDFWINSSASQMAQHISLNGPKTQFAQEKELGIVETGEKGQDKMTRHYIDQIDEMAPGLSDEMTSEYMSVQKTQSMIQTLEKKCEVEKVGFEHLDEYEQDKMLLDHLKSQIKDDANQNVVGLA